MDGSRTIFWGLVVVLFGASTFFGVSAARMAAPPPLVDVQSGDLVDLDSVVDGDSVVVRTEAGETVPVRILGVKSLEGVAKDGSDRSSAAAAELLRRKLKDQPIRVMVNDPPRDKHGRLIATLYVQDDDVGLVLIREGLALAYTVYPFPAMSLYVSEQATARANKRGLWAEPRDSARADSLQREWRRRQQ